MVFVEKKWYVTTSFYELIRNREDRSSLTNIIVYVWIGALNKVLICTKNSRSN